MSKRLLSEGILDKFFSLFLKAKAQNKESDWLSRLRKEDPELADIWSDWDKHTDKLLTQSRQALKDAGAESDYSNVDAIIKKYS
jgi:hypothetical protein